MRKRITALFTVMCLLLSFTGCSFVNLDMSGQMRPPHAAGEQSAVQEALEEYIYAQNMQPDSAATSYILKYPKMGDYRSAFVFKDMDGDGQDEALAFYAMQPEESNTHIVLFHKTGDIWLCADDIEGLATEIERIAFGDLNGDGCAELFAGFSMYNTRDRRLMVYTFEEQHFSERYTDTYTNMIVGPITDDDCDDLLLFRLNATEQKSTVRLLSMKDDTIVEKGSAALDGQIREFGKYTIRTVDTHARAVFQDCIKDSSTTITELIVWDGKQLTTPLYDPAENITAGSVRESGLPSLDIDDDGQIEWPRSFRMPGYEKTPTEEMKLWLTEWYGWNYEKTTEEKKLTNIVNVTDGYYLTIPEEWIGKITASYDGDARRMTLRYVDNGVISDVFLKLQTVSGGQSDTAADREDYIFMASDGTTQYEVWYDKSCPLGPTMEQLRELFTICTIE